MNPHHRLISLSCKDQAAVMRGLALILLLSVMDVELT
jgi:hypothetical protein